MRLLNVNSVIESVDPGLRRGDTFSQQELVMSENEKLQQQLDRLGREITTDTSIADAVMERIAKIPMEPVRSKKLWGTLMKSKMTQYSTAAAVILIAAGLWIIANFTQKAYGMDDALEFLKNARTLHIKGWFVNSIHEDVSDTNPQLPFEKWYDFERGLFRSTQGSVFNEEGKIELGSRVYDGKYLMYETRTKMNDGRRWKTIHYRRPNSFKHQLMAHEMAGLIYQNLDKVPGFVKIDENEINGTAFDVWQGEYTRQLLEELQHWKIQCWLSPETGKIGRIKTWIKRGESWFHNQKYQI